MNVSCTERGARYAQSDRLRWPDARAKRARTWKLRTNVRLTPIAARNLRNRGYALTAPEALQARAVRIAARMDEMHGHQMSGQIVPTRSACGSPGYGARCPACGEWFYLDMAHTNTYAVYSLPCEFTADDTRRGPFCKEQTT